jgi:hypothetical protein
MPAGDLGTFRKVDPHAIDDDPFWSVVRRRHPDVDIVLLPDEPEDQDEPTATPEVEAALEAELDDAWQLLQPIVAATGAPAAEEPPSRRVAAAADGPAPVLQKAVCGLGTELETTVPGPEQRAAVRGLGQDGGTDLLRDVAVTLGRAGWRLNATTRDGRPLLRARHGRLQLRAEAGAGATVLAVTAW